ncbi:methyltransferase domain-containing protein [Streptomyces sp. NPDC005970]|uniref:methyltransferase domain-containing protein n=1 Tax=Streptomyces sp. NPDC005970 TaxID=3156723 RepID=UPI0033FF7E3F
MVRVLNWRPRARDLADALEESGDLHSLHWRAAIEETPRHEFVPRYYQNQGGVPTVWRQVESNDGPAWFDPIYANATLVTQLDPVTVHATTDGWTGVPSSSSTAPGLMVRMLEALDIAADHTVLEIGTGTGYNAALIAHRLQSAEQLTTADIDPVLTGAARSRLQACDHNPTVLTCDASEYLWPRAYDCVIATCGLPRIGESLRAAVATGGRLIANVMPPLSAGLAVLTAADDGTLQGHFHPDGGTFMPARHDATTYARTSPADLGGLREGEAGIPLEAFDDYRFKFLLAARLPGVELQYGIEDGRVMRRLILPDGSSSEAWYEEGRPLSYRERGEQEVWAVATRCWEWYERNDLPSWERFGLTVTPKGHHFWFEHPDQVLTSF